MTAFFEEKAKLYRSKPNYMYAAKYEKGMENGWVIEFYDKNNEETGCNFIIFDSENEASKYFNLKPIYEETIIRDGEEFKIQHEVEYFEPKPCLWHWRTHKISDFDYQWDEQEYQIIEENDYIVRWQDSDQLGTHKDWFMNMEWEIDN